LTDVDISIGNKRTPR